MEDFALQFAGSAVLGAGLIIAYYGVSSWFTSRRGKRLPDPHPKRIDPH